MNNFTFLSLARALSFSRAQIDYCTESAAKRAAHRVICLSDEESSWIGVVVVVVRGGEMISKGPPERYVCKGREGGEREKKH